LKIESFLLLLKVTPDRQKIIIVKSLKALIGYHFPQNVYLLCFDTF